MKYYTLDQLSTLNKKQQEARAFLQSSATQLNILCPPQLHQPALDDLGEDARYIRVEVEADQVGNAFQELRNAGIHGVNVTVPHKLEALEACDLVDPAAQMMGAVNTVIFDKEGSCTGFKHRWTWFSPGPFARNSQSTLAI